MVNVAYIQMLKCPLQKILNSYSWKKKKRKKTKSMELEMLTWDLGEQGSSLSSVR